MQAIIRDLERKNKDLSRKNVELQDHCHAAAKKKSAYLMKQNEEFKRKINCLQHELRKLKDDGDMACPYCAQSFEDIEELKGENKWLGQEYDKLIKLKDEIEDCFDEIENLKIEKQRLEQKIHALNGFSNY